MSKKESVSIGTRLDKGSFHAKLVRRTGGSDIKAAGIYPSAETILRQCTLFHGLDDAGLCELAGRARMENFRSGETIFDAGSPGQEMMAVVIGIVRISLPSVTGKELILADLGSGDVFGEIALLDGRARSATATAHKACSLLLLHRRDVLSFLRKRPDFCITLLELLCARLRRSDDRMADIAFFDVPARLAKALVSRVAAAADSTLEVALSQSDLAKMVGSSRENVNRCLREWQRQGLVQVVEGRIRICKMSAVVALAGIE